MAFPHILNASALNRDQVIVELSDGRALAFSVQQLLTLTPVSEMTEEDANQDDGESFVAALQRNEAE